MTKSTGVGRGKGGGGRKPGAGRPRKPSALAVAAGAVVKRVEEKISAAAPTPTQTDAPTSSEGLTATSLRQLALETLEQIMQCSERDAARVSAAKEVLLRAESESEVTGKKAVAKAKAHERASGGKFAAPPPPSAMVSKAIQ